MICPKCNKELPDGAKFCMECGSDISSISGDSADLSLGEMKTVAPEHRDVSLSDISLGDMSTLGEFSSGMLEESGFVSFQPLEDKYDIHEEIGSGGFAKVYRATDKELGRTVAIK
ncbi:MAG: protein kinase family protein, partial [Verrucomicrobiota bacterium]|nr:protein kinase family protein [Verrucomicrobiota bacterium]